MLRAGMGSFLSLKEVVMPSYFDQLSHPFQCKNPQCRENFEKPLRSLVIVDEVVCPKCGSTQDIRESKRTGEIGKDFDTATELDKKNNKQN
jgi:transcription initiation factor IIE alpha subunit